MQVQRKHGVGNPENNCLGGSSGDRAYEILSWELEEVESSSTGVLCPCGSKVMTTDAATRSISYVMCYYMGLEILQHRGLDSKAKITDMAQNFRPLRLPHKSLDQHASGRADVQAVHANVSFIIAIRSPLALFNTD